MKNKIILNYKTFIFIKVYAHQLYFFYNYSFSFSASRLLLNYLSIQKEVTILLRRSFF